jgi:ABC-2 type transport system ATP-binding protein
VLITTHYMDEADKLCDRIAIVDHGTLVALDSPMALKASVRGKNAVEASFAGAPPDWKERLERLPGVERVAGEGAIYRISTSDGPETTSALISAAAAAGVAVRSLAVHSTTLDDVFVHYTGHDLRDALQEPSVKDRLLVRPGR